MGCAIWDLIGSRGVLFIIHYSCWGDEAQSDGRGEEWIGMRRILKLECEPDRRGNCFHLCASGCHSHRYSFNDLGVGVGGANVGDGSGSV